MTDDEISRLLADPALIETREQAVEILDCLDAEIANIQAQVDAYQIEANGRPMPEDRQSWLRRACYAGAMRRNERHRVIARDRELRAPPKKVKEPGEGAAKHERLKVEAEARREAAKVDGLKQQAILQALHETRAVNKLFKAVAHERLAPDLFEEIHKEAVMRRDAALIAQAIATQSQDHTPGSPS